MPFTVASKWLMGSMERDAIIYRDDAYGELPAISQLMAEVFYECIAPGYDPLGKNEFLSYIHPAAIAYRIKRNHFLRVAEAQKKIVGVLEMRNTDHLSLLFVATPFQRQGIARTLVSQAIAICRSKNPDLTDITVHADPNAMPAYRAMGFIVTGQERTENGIRYIPMKYHLH